MQHRKMKRFVQLRLVPFLVAAILTVSPLSLCASAAVWEGSGNLGYTYWNVNTGVPYYNGLSVNFPVIGAVRTGLIGNTLNGNRVDLSGVQWSSPVSIYVSGYYRNSYLGHTITEVGDPYDEANYEISFEYDTGTKGYGTIQEVSIFTPQVSDDWVVSDGMTLWAMADASEGRPISNVKLRPIVECGFKAQGGISTAKGEWFWSSVRIIGAENSEELGMLDNVASEIIAGNEILESMKGDVVALLQDIYRSTSNIDTATTAVGNILKVIRDTLNEMNIDVGNIATVTISLSQSVLRNLPLILSAINSHGEIIEGKLDDVLDYFAQIVEQLEGSGDYAADTREEIEQGEQLQEGLGELQRPDYEDIDLNVGDYIDQFDGGSGDSAAAMSGFMGTIFGSSMITSMLMISLTFCMVAYVLYGKR